MKKLKLHLSILAAAALLLPSCDKSTKEGTYEIKDGIIYTEVPQRPEGQKDVVGLRLEPMDSVRVGFIGLGMRGPGAVNRFSNIDRTSIKALCDRHADRVEASQKILADNGRPAAAEYVGDSAWMQLCDRLEQSCAYGGLRYGAWQECRY